MNSGSGHRRLQRCSRSGFGVVEGNQETGLDLKFVDLFSGCGGLSEGFKQAGWEPVFAVEKASSAALAYQANFRCVVWVGLVEDFISELETGRLALPPLRAVVGSPPCQGFSPLGKMSARPETKRNHVALNDSWSVFLRAVEILQPPVFLTENVPEFLRSAEFVQYAEAAERLGYTLAHGVLKAEDFGVPQKRRRAFCIGSRGGWPCLPTGNGERTNVLQAIGHLSREPSGYNWHVGRNPTPKSVERYKLIPPGGNRFDLVRQRPDLAPPCWLSKKTGTTDVFGRLEWDKPASTIRTEFFKPEKGRYLHPEAHRPITHREAAALQSFPESFLFKGSKMEVARQIGEAVPPMLAKAVATSMLELLDRLGVREDL
jgi:DNA (cytosine-5)-methyltransferase 1